MELIKKNKWMLLGAMAGGVAGYAYYYFVGCVDGTCSITSQPLNSTLYGVMMGGLLFNGFDKAGKEKSNSAEI